MIAKRFLVVTGLVMMVSLIGNTNKTPFGMTAYASETYSDNWKVDNAGNWRYYLNDGSVVTDAWVQDHGEWYLLGSDGNMRTGIFRSNGGKYYILDTVRGTGTHGKLLKNGSVYLGVTLQCDTTPDYEGALSEETVESLRAAGMDFINVPDVQNTKHVENGAAAGAPEITQPENNTGSFEDGGVFNWESLTEEQIRDGSGYTGNMNTHWH